MSSYLICTATLQVHAIIIPIVQMSKLRLWEAQDFSNDIYEGDSKPVCISLLLRASFLPEDGWAGKARIHT